MTPFFGNRHTGGGTWPRQNAVNVDLVGLPHKSREVARLRNSGSDAQRGEDISTSTVEQNI